MGEDDNDGKEDYDEDVGGYRWRGSQTTINQKWQRKKWQGRRQQRARTATTMGKDDNDGREDDSEANGNKMATMARMTGKDGEDNRRGRWWHQGWQRGPLLAAAAMVMRGLLAVGRLVLSLAQILHKSRNSIDVHTQLIFFRSKIFRPVLLQDYFGTGLRYYFVAGAKIVPQKSICNRNKTSALVTIFCEFLTRCGHMWSYICTWIVQSLPPAPPHNAAEVAAAGGSDSVDIGGGDNNGSGNSYGNGDSDSGNDDSGDEDSNSDSGGGNSNSGK
jgi:hypothetical protein